MIVTADRPRSMSGASGGPDHPARGRSVALFDLDRTLIHGSSLSVLGRTMVRHGQVRSGTVAREFIREISFARHGAHDHTVERLQRRLLALAAGRSYRELAVLATEAAADVVERVYPAARWLVRRHRESGDLTVIVSASPHELVAAVAAAVGADAGVGTRSEVIDGTLTGRLAGVFCYGAGKLVQLRAELGELDLSSSTAYSDSVSDLPMLHACATAVAANPDRRLLAVARREGWPVVHLA